MMIEMKFALCCFVAQMSSKEPQAAVDVINNNTASSLQWQLLIQLLHAAGPKLRIADLRDVALDREALRLVSTSTVPPNWLWHPCRLAF
jgi:hypothetical protein